MWTGRTLPVLASMIIMLASSASFAQDVLAVPRHEEEEAPTTEVVCRQALVFRDGDSTLEAGCEAAGGASSVLLVSGGFLVHAGAAAVDVKLGDAVIRVAKARLAALAVDGTWYVMVSWMADTGRADLLARTEASEEEGTPAGRRPVPLAPGKVLSIPTPDTLKPLASGKIVKDMIALSTKLDPAGGKTGKARVLAYRAVEEQRDFKVASGGVAESAGELEIEDIEVEVGCVEICVD